jgi:hypothetical protein
MKLKILKITWFFRGRYSRHSDAMQPKIEDFPALKQKMIELGYIKPWYQKIKEFFADGYISARELIDEVYKIGE